MRKIPILMIVLVLIGTGFLSGCTSNTSNTNQNSPTTTYTSSLSYVNRNDQGQVTEACVEVQNTGDNGAWFTVDFAFMPYDKNALGSGVDRGGNTTYIPPEPFHIDEQVYVDAHKSNTVICQPLPEQPAISLQDYTVRLGLG